MEYGEKEIQKEEKKEMEEEETEGGKAEEGEGQGEGEENIRSEGLDLGETERIVIVHVMVNFMSI